MIITRLLQQANDKYAEPKIKKKYNTRAEIVASMFLPFGSLAWQLQH